MTIKFDEATNTWKAMFSKRHPKTGEPISRKRVGLPTKAAAIRAERELVSLVEQKIHEKVFPKWELAIDLYIQSCHERDLAKKTIYNADKCLRAATLPDWSGYLVSVITTQDIRDLINGKYEGSSETHRKAILKFVKGVFHCLVERGILDRNPSPIMKFKIGNKIPAVLTEQQTFVLLTKAKDYQWAWYPHVSMALYTGMRNGELFALTWDKVNLDQRKILVNCSWNNKDGVKPTKSGDDRIVEIAPQLLPILSELKLKSVDSNHVLPRVPRWAKGDQARELRMFLMGIGLPIITFHNLRAVWATIILGKGVEPVKVMSMGGWKDMKTMMVYIRKAGIDIKGITDKLDLHDPYYTEAKVLDFTQHN